MTLLIDTRAVPESRRVEFWTSSSRDVYHPLRIDAGRDGPSDFRAQMWGDWVGPVGIFRVSASANTMHRGRAEITAGDPECLHVSILLTGSLEGEQQERSSVLRPGDITAYDTSAPAVFRAPGPFDLLVLKLPKVGMRAQPICRLTGLRIPGQRGLPRAAVQFFCGVATGVADGSIGPDDTDIAERVIDLVSRLYRDLGATRPVRLGSHSALLERALAYVDQNLGDPDLSPSQVARASYISTRYLHRLFAEEGLSVSQWIRAERLGRCRRDLLDPEFATTPVAEIGARWGFTNPSHFTRLFHGAYGLPPREFRRTASQDGPPVA